MFRLMTLLAAVIVMAGLFAAPGAAQMQGTLGLPALYDVTGVDADDTLNLRDSPRASAQKIGELAPDAFGIEVTALSDSGDWGRIALPEGAAWANMRFLAPQPGSELPFLDRPLTCFGTEPFWNLSFDTARPAALDRLNGVPQGFRLGLPLKDRNRSEAVLGNADDGTSMVAVVRPAQCNDGMSDAVFGLATEVILLGTGGAEMLTGCCTLTAR